MSNQIECERCGSRKGVALITFKNVSKRLRFHLCTNCINRAPSEPLQIVDWIRDGKKEDR